MGLNNPFRSKRFKRVGTAILTMGASEIINAGRHYAEDPYKDITGITAMERQEAAAKELAAQQSAEEAQNLADQYAAIEKARKKRARMQGRASTILAGGSSLGTNDFSVMRKTLLGG